MSEVSLHIPSELFAPAESLHFAGVIDIPLLKAGPDIYTFERDLSWSVDITNTGDAFLVMGTVEGIAQTSCARCLEEFSFPVTGEIEGYYLISPDTQAPEDMDDDEFAVLPENHCIDLEPLIHAALLLEAPLVPLCRESCLGLCPQCGMNLNEGTCTCFSDSGFPKGEEEAPHPFAALKNFSFEDN